MSTFVSLTSSTDLHKKFFCQKLTPFTPLNRLASMPLKKFFVRNTFVAILFCYFLSLLMTAFVTPLIFNIAVWWNAYYPPTTFDLNHYVQKGIGIFFDRIRLISMLLFCPFLFKLYRYLTVSEKYTFRPRLFIKFFLLGSVLILSFFSAKMYFFEFSIQSISFFRIGYWFAVTLLLVCVEEWLFRGLIFKSLEQKLPVFLAIICSSFIFAYFHFRPTIATPDDPGMLSSGFYCLKAFLFDTFTEIYWRKFAVLFVLGILFCSVYCYERSLLASIGLHFGIVFTLTLINEVITFTSTNDWFGNNHLFNAPIAFILILTLTIYYFLLLTYKKKGILFPLNYPKNSFF